MKILGFSAITPPCREVVVGLDPTGAPVVLRLIAPPVGSFERLAEELPYPEPPVGEGVARDPKTNEPLRDASGNYLPVRNHRDPGYLQRKRDVDTARAFASLLLCFDPPDQLTTEARREAFPTPLAFYLALHREFTEAGIREGAMTALLRSMMDLTRADDWDGLKEAVIRQGKETRPSPP